MKKISVFLLTLVAGISLAACGSKTTSKKTTQAPAPAPTPTPDPTPTYQTYTSDSYADIMNAIGDKFMIDVTLAGEDQSGTLVSYDATLAVDSENDYLLFGSPDGSMYIKPYVGNDDLVLMYVYDTEVDAYLNVYVESEEEMSQYIVVDEALAIACGLTIKYTSKDESFEFLSRPCTQYLYNYKQGTTDMTEEYVIDTETGLCLKHAIYSSATPAQTTITEATFEVKAFTLGDDVEDYFDAQDALIEVIPWDETFLYGCGFRDSGANHFGLAGIVSNYSGTVPTITLATAELYSDYDGHYYCLDTVFCLDGTDKVKGDFASAIASNLFGCGAKYNFEGVVQSSINTLATFTPDSEDENIIKKITFAACLDTEGIYEVSYSYEYDYYYQKTTIYLSVINNNFAPTPVNIYQ